MWPVSGGANGGRGGEGCRDRTNRGYLYLAKGGDRGEEKEMSSLEAVGEFQRRGWRSSDGRRRGASRAAWRAQERPAGMGKKAAGTCRLRVEWPRRCSEAAR